jgi:hypothetical protein
VAGDTVRSAQSVIFGERGKRKDSSRHNKGLRYCGIPNRVGVTGGAVSNQINTAGVTE